MPTTQSNGLIFTSINEKEAFVGTAQENTDSNAIVGPISPFLSFPETVEIEGNTCLVTTVGKRAFRHCDKVKTLRIHRYIKTIKYQAFDWCINCHKITFDRDSNLESIGESSFYSNAYTEIILPKSLKSFGGGSFGYNNNIKKFVYLGTTNPGQETDLFHNGTLPECVYVGLDYPDTTFFGIQVKRIANINSERCTKYRCNKFNSFLFALSLIYCC